MLNISRNRIKGKVNLDKYESYRWVMQEDFKSLPRVLLGLFGLMVALLFLPWTQNIQSRGFITTLNPSQRPQMVNTVIPGKIDKWYIREGQFVNKGDTLVKLTEIKDDYLDPALLSRTEEQIEAKERTVRSYQDKVQALDAQIIALENARKLKLEQARNYVMQAQLKVESDSMNVLAAETNFLIAERQLQRTETLFAEGLKSVVEVENLKNKTQEAASKKISAENKLLSSRNQLINAQIDLSGIEAEYRDKLAKAESDKYSAISALYEGEGTLVKMRNMFSNYSLRADLYYILAPQSGYVVRMAKAGIGEVIKESEQLVSIIPEDYTMAVEMFVEPIDLPLVKIGQPVRFVFDGWPAIVFSGWPNTSFGTYGGRVVAVDNFIYPNGKYRLLVSPDPQDVPWPRELRMGTGAKGMALLNDVPIWYEFWRRINGFPPEYYYGVSSTESEGKEEKK